MVRPAFLQTKEWIVWVAGLVLAVAVIVTTLATVNARVQRAVATEGHIKEPSLVYDKTVLLIGDSWTAGST